MKNNYTIQLYKNNVKCIFTFATREKCQEWFEREQPIKNGYSLLSDEEKKECRLIAEHSRKMRIAHLNRGL